MDLTPANSMSLPQFFKQITRVHGGKRVPKIAKRKGENHLCPRKEPVHHVNSDKRPDKKRHIILESDDLFHLPRESIVH